MEHTTTATTRRTIKNKIQNKTEGTPTDHTEPITKN